MKLVQHRSTAVFGLRKVQPPARLRTSIRGLTRASNKGVICLVGGRIRSGHDSIKAHWELAGPIQTMKQLISGDALISCSGLGGAFPLGAVRRDLEDTSIERATTSSSLILSCCVPQRAVCSIEDPQKVLDLWIKTGAATSVALVLRQNGEANPPSCPFDCEGKDDGSLTPIRQQL